MEIKRVEIYKSGRMVAFAEQGIKTVSIGMAGIPPMEAFSLPIVELDRRVVFEHMQGRPLSDFFDFSGARVEYAEAEEAELQPMFYVHGRSEALRGNMTVTAVVLIRFDCPPDQVPSVREIRLNTPEIYRKVSYHLPLT